MRVLQRDALAEAFELGDEAFGLAFGIAPHRVVVVVIVDPSDGVARADRQRNAVKRSASGTVTHVVIVVCLPSAPAAIAAVATRTAASGRATSNLRMETSHSSG